MDVLVLDTNIVSFLMKGDTRAKSYRPHLEGKTLAISFMTVGELYEGAYRRAWSKEKFAKLRERIKSYLVIPFSPVLCETWGRIRAERKSRPIAVDDGWIAATALAHGCRLVTHNPSDFTGITGLQIVTEKTDGQE
ncbi:MAG: type II toxin-antitoxin system VapC family toxin [Planctomycetes bacterium]|nr:type II toxin-antitoxin system VapC family toxin [Planctomycetota bacterium]